MTNNLVKIKQLIKGGSNMILLPSHLLYLSFAVAYLEVDFHHSADHTKQLYYQHAHLSCCLGSTLCLLEQKNDNVI